MVTAVIRKLLPSECQKFVTRIASEKLLKFHVLGNESAPAMSFVISVGLLNAIMTVMYNGNNTVRQPRNSSTVRSTLVPPILCVFFIAVPPSYR